MNNIFTLEFFRCKNNLSQDESHQQDYDIAL